MTPTPPASVLASLASTPRTAWLGARAMVFASPESQSVHEHIERVAPTDATVLIQGETGTGKELVARRIHELSGRRGPFVAVNCGALTQSLADSELFGHQAGSFTGASDTRAGWFEAANKGHAVAGRSGGLAAVPAGEAAASASGARGRARGRAQGGAVGRALHRGQQRRAGGCRRRRQLSARPFLSA